MNQGWVGKSTTGTEYLKVARTEVILGTWNVRTLRESGRLELLKHELNRYKWDIIGLSEVRWTGKGEADDGHFLWSGEDRVHHRGVGLLLNKTAKKALLGFNPVNSRIISARFKAQPMHLTVIQVYALTADCDDSEINHFYSMLNDTMKQVPKKYILMIMGDWNAKVGPDDIGHEDISELSILTPNVGYYE